MNPVYAIGPLPPPVHGASVITKNVIDLLQSSGVSVVALNTSPTSSRRNWQWHASRVAAYLRCCRALLAAPRGAKVYLSLSGGSGLAYDLLIVIIARLKAHQLVFHHHSYAYIDRWRPAFAALLRAAPPGQIHVVLCRDMQTGLEQRYRRTLNAVPVSNLSFVMQDAPRFVSRIGIRRIGFLSNIAMDKGIDRFLDLAERVAAIGVEVHIAGPFADSEVKAYVESRMRSLGNVVNHGPVFGADKQRFYREIDLFVLLSRYANEAEPLVVYEAMAAGLPVAVTARGCLCELADKPHVVVHDREGADLAPLVTRIADWRADPKAYQSASLAAIDHVNALRQERAAQLAAFLATLAPDASGRFESAESQALTVEP
jgi:glycosyltransferase involved in cell wall biosynthesis